MKPTTASGLQPSQTVPVVSTDYSHLTPPYSSEGRALIRSSGGGCPAGNYSVITISGEGAPINGVGFSMLVP